MAKAKDHNQEASSYSAAANHHPPLLLIDDLLLEINPCAIRMRLKVMPRSHLRCLQSQEASPNHVWILLQPSRPSRISTIAKGCRRLGDDCDASLIDTGLTFLPTHPDWRILDSHNELLLCCGMQSNFAFCKVKSVRLQSCHQNVGFSPGAWFANRVRYASGFRSSCLKSLQHLQIVLV